MQSLREKLIKLFLRPDLLPSAPEGAINGTDLLKLVKPLLGSDYADPTIRQHFSVMSADATSPIAKVAQGHGYYRRAEGVLDGEEAATSHENTLTVVDDRTPHTTSSGSRVDQPEERFRALYMRYVESRNRFAVKIEHTAAAKQDAGVNKWKFPDVIVLDWEVGRVFDGGYEIDAELLEVRKSLGEQPFRLTSVELKVDLTFASFRQSFFQCVSNSKWAHNATLITAKAVSDEILTNELRRLGTSFDVSVSSFGLTNEILDELCSADQILAMPDDEFEHLADRFSFQSVSTGKARDTLDWDHIQDLRKQSSDFSATFAWINRCLLDAKPYNFKDYETLAVTAAKYR